MTHRVGPKGQVVIPKAIRDELGLQPGDRVEFELDGGVVRLRPVRSMGGLGGTFRGFDLVGALEADRRAEPR